MWFSTWARYGLDDACGRGVIRVTRIPRPISGIRMPRLIGTMNYEFLRINFVRRLFDRVTRFCCLVVFVWIPLKIVDAIHVPCRTMVCVQMPLKCIHANADIGMVGLSRIECSQVESVIVLWVLPIGMCTFQGNNFKNHLATVC